MNSLELKEYFTVYLLEEEYKEKGTVNDWHQIELLVLMSNTWNPLIVCKQRRSVKNNVNNKLFAYKSYIYIYIYIYMYIYFFPVAKAVW